MKKFVVKLIILPAKDPKTSGGSGEDESEVLLKIPPVCLPPEPPNVFGVLLEFNFIFFYHTVIFLITFLTKILR